MKTPPRHPLLRLLRYARAYRRRIWAATLCSILNKVFDLAPPVLIGAAIDVVVEQDDSVIASFGFPTVMGQLTVLAVVTVIIWALESIFEYLFAVLWRNLAQSLEHDLRVNAYRHVQELELAHFEDRSIGGLMSILNDDVNQLERFLDGAANQLLQVGTTVVVIGIAFFGLSPAVFGLAFLPIPLILWGSFHFQKRIAPRYADVRERVGALNGQLANNLGGIVTIKSFTAESHEVGRVDTLSRAYEESNTKAIKLSSAFAPLIRMVIVCGFTGTLVYGGHLTQTGDLAVGAYSVLVFMTQRLLWPLTRLGETFDLYQRAMASTTRILDLLDTPVGIVGGATRLDADAVAGELVFEDVSFAYANGVPVIRDLTLTMPAGQTTAIVGSTGSGKSTLVKLLLRFYDVTSGRVQLDGVPLPELDTSDLRGAIGLVSQDVFLFHGTVAENIRYGRRDATDGEIEEAARIADADGFISALPDGYQTLVGERGQKLSGGQRQRLSIARAVLKDPPILILDEATSSVDNETEAAIQTSMETIAQGRTTVVIAHRLSTVRNAHRIHVLDRGQIVESGRHDELLAQAGVYSALWSAQGAVGSR